MFVGMCLVYKMVSKVYFDLSFLGRDWLPDIHRKVAQLLYGVYKSITLKKTFLKAI